MNRVCFCAVVFILCFFYKVVFAQGDYQENYEAVMKEGLAAQQTELNPGALSYRLEEGYAFYSHVLKTKTKKQATFAVVSFDVNDEKKGLLDVFCREHARELLLRNWLREFLQGHLEVAINKRIDVFEDGSDDLPSKSETIEVAREAVPELLLNNAFAQYDLESICRGVLKGCREKTKVDVITLKGGKSGWFFFAQYFVDEKAVEENVSEDVRGIMVAWRKALCGELARVLQGQANPDNWSEAELKLMRAYVVLIYVLGGDFANWPAFCEGDTPLHQAPENFRWKEFINLIFKK